MLVRVVSLFQALRTTSVTFIGHNQGPILNYEMTPALSGSLLFKGTKCVQILTPDYVVITFIYEFLKQKSHFMLISFAVAYPVMYVGIKHIEAQ